MGNSPQPSKMGNSPQPSTMDNSPQLLTMDNSPQLSTMDKLSVNYKHGRLQTDISNLQTSKVEFLEINWSDTSSQDRYTHCREEILRFLESHKFPKAKRLVLNNLFYSYKLLYNLICRFKNIEHLKILPFNCANADYFMACFRSFSTLSELEIALGSLDHIGLILPKQLKELTLSISKVASESMLEGRQEIDLTCCRSLESL